MLFSSKNEAVLRSKPPKQINDYVIMRVLRTQRNHYFVKMASSLRDSHVLARGKPIRSQTKHTVMNVWNYFDQEAKKARRSAGNISEKVSKATGKFIIFVLWHHAFMLCCRNLRTNNYKHSHRIQRKEWRFLSPLKKYVYSHVRKDADQFDRDAI